MRSSRPSYCLYLALTLAGCSDPGSIGNLASGGAENASGGADSGGAGGNSDFGEPIDPDFADYPVVDRFSEDAATLLVRDDSSGLPEADEPIDFDQAPFLVTALGPHGEIVQYYNFDVQPDVPAPIYALFRPGGDTPVQPNLVAAIPGVPGYSDLWRVMKVTVPEDYVPNTITSVSELLAADLEIEMTDTIVNCPVVPHGSTAELRGSRDSNALTRGWYDDKVIYYFNFFEAPLTVKDNGKIATSAIYVSFNVNPDETDGGAASGFVTEDGSEQTHNVIATLPNDEGYSPLWSMNVYDNADFDSVTDLATATDANLVDENIATVNYPVVSVEP